MSDIQDEAYTELCEQLEKLEETYNDALEKKDAEIERLKTEATDMLHNNFCLLVEIGEHKELHARAADALKDKAFNQMKEKDWDLVDELRKAAE